MGVDWAIACRFVEVHDNLVTVVGGGIDRTTVPALPAQIAFMLAVRFVAPPEELGQDNPHPLRLAITSPSGGLVSELDAEFAAERIEPGR